MSVNIHVLEGEERELLQVSWDYVLGEDQEMPGPVIFHITTLFHTKIFFYFFFRPKLSGHIRTGT
jgi:hypothetical protein